MTPLTKGRSLPAGTKLVFLVSEQTNSDFYGHTCFLARPYDGKDASIVIAYSAIRGYTARHDSRALLLAHDGSPRFGILAKKTFGNWIKEHNL